MIETQENELGDGYTETNMVRFHSSEGWIETTPFAVLEPLRPFQIETSDGSVLDLAGYAPEACVPTLVSASGRLGFFIGEESSACFVEPEQLPPRTLAAIAAAADLPDAHRIIASAADPDSVDFHDACITIVAQLKALLEAQGLTSLRLPHSASPNLSGDNQARN